MLVSAGVVMKLRNLPFRVENHQRRETSRRNSGVRRIRREQKIAVIAVGDGQLVVELHRDEVGRASLMCFDGDEIISSI